MKISFIYNETIINLVTKLINGITIIMFLWSMLFFIYPAFDVSSALHPQWRHEQLSQQQKLQNHNSYHNLNNDTHIQANKHLNNTEEIPGFGIACMQGQIAGAMNLPFAAFFVYTAWFSLQQKSNYKNRSSKEQCNHDSRFKLWKYHLLRLCCSIVQTLQCCLLVILGGQHLIMKRNFDSHNTNTQFWLDHDRMLRDTIFMGVLLSVFIIHSTQQYYKLKQTSEKLKLQ
eukprot:gb/GECH01011841.1/.p1 GENE.gb/GECH01011841.1/~~gb/GECH01011841.1/.p1  ORF type:complete len:229 (+),score=27.90 gb/GECH01011841.1/:1-687(+)